MERTYYIINLKMLLCAFYKDKGEGTFSKYCLSIPNLVKLTLHVWWWLCCAGLAVRIINKNFLIHSFHLHCSIHINLVLIYQQLLSWCCFYVIFRRHKQYFQHHNNTYYIQSKIDSKSIVISIFVWWVYDLALTVVLFFISINTSVVFLLSFLLECNVTLYQVWQ